MVHSIKSRFRFLSAFALILTACLLSGFLKAKAQDQHPVYSDAIYNLNQAKWMILHGAGDTKQTAEEVSAVNFINSAIKAIRISEYEDNISGNAGWRPAQDRINERESYIDQIITLLKKAKEDLRKPEVDRVSRESKENAFDNIKDAIHSVRKIRRS